MRRFICLTMISAILFGAGLLAGQGVPGHSRQPSVAIDKVEPATETVPSSPRGTLNVDSPDPPFSTISDSRDLESAKKDQLTSSIVEIEKSTTEPPESSPEERRQVRELILRIFPDANADTVEVWVESYTGMELGEVEFVLEQKRAASGSLDSQLSNGLLAPIPAPLEMASDVSSAQHVIGQAMKSVTLNLRNSMAAGYRKIVVVPEAVSNTQPINEATSNPFHVTTFRSMQIGRLISSPAGTHVAIASADEHYFFGLNENQVTRRGDFALLPDRRLGLITSQGTFSLKNSAPLPVDAVGLRITSAGEILYDDASGNSLSAGSIELACVKRLDDLSTLDGVVFQCPAGSKWEIVTAQVANLVENRLELSNVDYKEEILVLGQLKAMLTTDFMAGQIGKTSETTF